MKWLSKARKWPEKVREWWLFQVNPWKYCLEYPDNIAFQCSPAMSFRGDAEDPYNVKSVQDTRVDVFRVSDNCYILSYYGSDVGPSEPDAFVRRLDQIFLQYGH